MDMLVDKRSFEYMEETTSRKVVQFQVLPGAPTLLIALCDDGSMWQRNAYPPEADWIRLPDIPQATKDATRPAEAGKRWESWHDDQLRTLWSEHQKTCVHIADDMQRTEGAIIARLVHLSIYPDRDTAQEADRARREKQTTLIQQFTS